MTANCDATWHMVGGMVLTNDDYAPMDNVLASRFAERLAER